MIWVRGMDANPNGEASTATDNSLHAGRSYVARSVTDGESCREMAVLTFSEQGDAIARP